LNEVNRELLSLIAHPERRDAGALSNFVTYSRRLKDKLVNFAALNAVEHGLANEESAAGPPEEVT
jgi:phosphate:Na+ symporter